MNLRSQAVSPQLVLTLFAAVAVNSAIWWHHKSSNRLVDTQDAEKKDKANCASQKGFNNVNERKRKAVLRKSRAGTKTASSPANHSTTPSKHRIHATHPVAVTSRTTSPKPKASRSPKKTPCVRESLLLRNGLGKQSQTEMRIQTGPKVLTRQINFYDPDSPSTESVASNATYKSTASRSRKGIQPKVRNSLLPWNVKASTPKLRTTSKTVGAAAVTAASPKMSSAKSPRITPRVRESLLPWNSKQNTTSSFVEIKPTDGAAMKSTRRRVPTVRDSLLPWNKNTDLQETPAHIYKITSTETKDEPEAFSEHTDNIKSTKGKDTPETFASPTSSSTDDATFESFLASRINDGYVTSRSRGKYASKETEDDFQSPVSYLKSGSKTTRSPLLDATNQNKQSKGKNRRVSRELKERSWKQSSTTSVSSASVKSPTLMQLSQRTDEHDVHSLRKVFDVRSER
eukprot:scaffold333_cov133-Cylindrotheca_fusiformis.AAC.5